MEVKKKLIKNINASEIYNLKELVDYREGIIESRTLSQGKNLSITLFAFDKNEEISAHSSPGDAFVYIIDGEAEINIGDKKFRLKEGQTIIMPAGIPHSLFAVERFKMLLIVIFEN
ncbi:cupin domain-containing protein [Thermovenabulum sp.]|uniref:cupin domain-containing protein n=1 Tax=Thermovenabulum sp. TaxID=3100335 RepID=UPI003C7BE294